MSEFEVKESLEKAIRLMGGELSKLEDESLDGALDTKSVWSLTTIAKTLLSIHKQSKEHPEDEEDFSSLTPEEIDVLAKQTVESMKEKIK